MHEVFDTWGFVNFLTNEEKTTTPLYTFFMKMQTKWWKGKILENSFPQRYFHNISTLHQTRKWRIWCLYLSICSHSRSWNYYSVYSHPLTQLIYLSDVGGKETQTKAMSPCMSIISCMCFRKSIDLSCAVNQVSFPYLELTIYTRETSKNKSRWEKQITHP